MKEEELKKEMEQIEKSLERYIRAKEKLQERIFPLESRKERIMEELNLAQNPEKYLNDENKNQPVKTNRLPLFQPAARSSKRRPGIRAVRPANILTALQHTKGILEILEQNIDKTFRTVDEITGLINTIKGHSGQISRLAKGLSTLGKKSNAAETLGSASELAKLVQNPLVRNLAKELLASLNKA